MSLRPYVKINLENSFAEPILRQIAIPYTFPLCQEEKHEINILYERSTQETFCVGLAAPQLGISKQAALIHVPDEEALKKFRPTLTQTMEKTLWFNPTWSPLDNEMNEDYEACFSVFDVAGIVKRHSNIAYKAYDAEGQKREGTAVGFLARVIQHEIDHLHGKLFCDDLPKNKIITIEKYVALRSR